MTFIDFDIDINTVIDIDIDVSPVSADFEFLGFFLLLPPQQKSLGCLSFFFFVPTLLEVLALPPLAAANGLEVEEPHNL